MPNIWYWLRKGNLKPNYVKVKGALTPEGFGPTYRFKQTAPDRQETFTGRGFTWAEVQAFIDKAMAPNDPENPTANLVTVMDHRFAYWRGAIADLSWEPVGEGGSIYWALNLVLDEPENVVGP